MQGTVGDVAGRAHDGNSGHCQPAVEVPHAAVLSRCQYYPALSAVGPGGHGGKSDVPTSRGMDGERVQDADLGLAAQDILGLEITMADGAWSRQELGQDLLGTLGHGTQRVGGLLEVFLDPTDVLIQQGLPGGLPGGNCAPGQRPGSSMEETHGISKAGAVPVLGRDASQVLQEQRTLQHVQNDGASRQEAQRSSFGVSVSGIQRSLHHDTRTVRKVACSYQ